MPAGLSKLRNALRRRDDAALRDKLAALDSEIADLSDRRKHAYARDAAVESWELTTAAARAVFEDRVRSWALLTLAAGEPEPLHPRSPQLGEIVFPFRLSSPGLDRAGVAVVAEGSARPVGGVAGASRRGRAGARSARRGSAGCGARCRRGGVRCGW
jgi:hypothetical protein